MRDEVTEMTDSSKGSKLTLPWSEPANRLSVADLSLFRETIGAEADGVGPPADEHGFLALFARALRAGAEGEGLVRAALDELASHGLWELLAEAAAAAGGGDAESPHAGALLRAWSRLGRDAELARLGGELAARDPQYLPPRYRLDVAAALFERGADPELARRVLASAVEYVGSKGREAEIERLFELLADHGGAPEVPAAIELCERIARRGQRVAGYAGLFAMALDDAGAPEALWRLVRDVTLSTGELDAVAAELAGQAIVTLYGAELGALGPRLERAARGADPRAEIEVIERAIEWRPGTFVCTETGLYWRVVACDGVQVTLANPAGMERREPLDSRLHERVNADSWPVRVAFFRESLRVRASAEPLAVVEEFLRDHPGKLTDLGLKAELTAQLLLRPAQWEAWFEDLRAAIGRGEGGVCYAARSRAFTLGKPKPAARATRKKAAKNAPPKRRVLPIPRPEAKAREPDLDSLELRIAAIPEAMALAQRLKGRISALERELRIELPERLRTAAAHGDLSENAEYDAAKERKATVEGLLTELAPRAQSLAATDGVRCKRDQAAVLRSVRIVELPERTRRVIHLVPNELADPDRAFVSIGSPLGKALNRRRCGETVEVSLPAGSREVTIQAVGEFGCEPE